MPLNFAELERILLIERNDLVIEPMRAVIARSHEFTDLCHRMEAGEDVSQADFEAARSALEQATTVWMIAVEKLETRSVTSLVRDANHILGFNL